jgi:hypothetical protein
VNIRLAKEAGNDGVLLRRSSEGNLAPNTRNGVRHGGLDLGARPGASSGSGQSYPREADRGQAGSAQPRRPRHR